MTQQNYYELLAAKMDKQKALFDSISLQTKAKAYQDIATGRYQMQTVSASDA